MRNLSERKTPETVGKVISRLLRHPFQSLILRWNWKSAFLSATMRSSIFFATYLISRESLKVAFGAMLVQFSFRTLLGGVNGAIIQSFSKVEPVWKSALIVPLMLSVFSHTIEFITQTAYDKYAGTTAKNKAILISIIISIISAVFNLFIMRRGTLLVKDDREQTLRNDMKRMPLLIMEFFLFPFIWIWRRAKNG
jgi:hypothetical protein